MTDEPKPVFGSEVVAVYLSTPRGDPERIPTIRVTFELPGDPVPTVDAAGLNETVTVTLSTHPAGRWTAALNQHRRLGALTARERQAVAYFTEQHGWSVAQALDYVERRGVPAELARELDAAALSAAVQPIIEPLPPVRPWRGKRQTRRQRKART